MLSLRVKKEFSKFQPLLQIMSMFTERPAPISFKLNGPKKRNNGVLVVGDSHVVRMGKENLEPNFSFHGIGGAQAHDWVRLFRDVIERSPANVIMIQLGGNDVSQNPRRVVPDQLPIGRTAQSIMEIMKFCRVVGKEAYIIQTVSRNNSRVHEEAIGLLNKRLREQRKNYFVSHDIEYEFLKDQVHLTPKKYAELLCTVHDFVYDMYYF